MELVCPVCTGLTETERKFCPYCGGAMVDRGPVANYLGPYSPYLDKDILDKSWQEKNNLGSVCVHVLYCSQCNQIKREKISLIAF